MLGCSRDKPMNVAFPFETVNSQQSGVDFINTVTNTPEFHIFLYRNFYNGGGVALGDINNDGKLDIFFTSNMGENKLYLNEGDWQFKDISTTAGITSAEKWSTGVTMIDMNNDGYLDIYVCNAGFREGVDQRNELYINNGDLTFTDKASVYNLDENGYTTHAAFFDYDLDGDLDVYILNNSFLPVNTLNYNNKRELPAENWPVSDFLKGGGDKLMRNDSGVFTDITREANIYNSLIGFGLGVTVGDVNGDHWPDLYISNDFFERDYLYINQKDGTFLEQIKGFTNHISSFSMGADMADINNDQKPDLFVTDMLPDDEYRLKTTTSFDNFTVQNLKRSRDFYEQFMQNTLQVNTGKGRFQEVAHYSGVAGSDWSWGALLFDVNNSGYRDIYVSNGIYHDVTDQDFIDFFANDVMQRMVVSGEKEAVDKVIDQMPSIPLKNKLFMNNGNLEFTDLSDHDAVQPSFSNGSAYGDLDNDGDLDLVVNNVNQEAFLLRNTSRQTNQNSYVQIQLVGDSLNRSAIGSKVYVFQQNQVQYFEKYLSRGFQSSVDPKMTFGLGSSAEIDSIQVIWPNQTYQTVKTKEVDTLISLFYDGSQVLPLTDKNESQISTFFEEIAWDGLTHKEDSYLDFFHEGLVIRLLSREGPPVAVADINGDGANEMYFGKALGNESGFYKLQEDTLRAISMLEGSGAFEDTYAIFCDIDSDGDNDLIVGSGGNHEYQGARSLQDRVYVNDGKGNFELNVSALPNNGYNTGVIVSWDYDNDGDEDLFIGSRSHPGIYGRSPRSYLLENNGAGMFKDVTSTIAPELFSPGMVTDASTADLNGDGVPELILVGEWMSPQVFSVIDEVIVPIASGLQEYSGWWYALNITDVDNDGDQDMFLGNRGENFFFTASMEQPAKLWVHDFDNNGTMEKIITRKVNGKDMTVHLKRELTEQIVSLKKQNLKHSEFANKSIQELFGPEELAVAKLLPATWFKSAVAINDGTGSFKIKPLPDELQYSSITEILPLDINEDGFVDFILGGNDSGFLPQFGSLDASYGHVLLNRGDGSFEVIGAEKSGFMVRGEVRALNMWKGADGEYILVGLNNSRAKLFKRERK
jgi:hypothetical protein